MDFLIYYILPFVFVLGVLIFFHELGHFLVAKYFNVKVLKFSLGFGPKIFGRTFGETEYLISAVPLGGYVKMLGESGDDEDDVPSSPEEEERSFNNQSVMKRIAIVAAGPFFNLFLALLVFCLFFMTTGKEVMTSEIGQVTEGSPAHQAGLAKGDIIVAIDGIEVRNWPGIKRAVKKGGSKELLITVKRGKSLLSVSLEPEISVVKNIFGEQIKIPLIGVVASGKSRLINLGPIDSVKEGFIKTWEITELTLLTIVKLFQRVVPIKTLGGPILIGQLTGQIAKEGIIYLFPFMAVISINLGILNLLPVPILDGGMILFLLFELITGKPMSTRKREWAQKIGLFLLISLMVLVIYNDVTRLIK